LTNVVIQEFFIRYFNMRFRAVCYRF